MADFLTLEEVEAELANARNRGAYGPRIEQFVSDQTLGVDFMTFPEFVGKDAQSVANSVNNNIKRLKADGGLTTNLQCKVSKDKTKVSIINLDILEAMRAGTWVVPNATPEGEEGTEGTEVTEEVEV